MMNLLDESWVPDNITPHVSTLNCGWARIQSLLMMAFLVVGEMAPLAAVAWVSYYTYKQVLVVAAIQEEFALVLTDYKDMVVKIGVSNFPAIPAVPFVFSDYGTFVISVVSSVILLVSLIQLIRDEAREVFLI
jgi:hypothetical protein